MAGTPSSTRQTRRIRCPRIVLATLLATLATLACAGTARAGEIDYDIAVMRLDDALRRFAEQSGQQVFYSPSLAARKTATPVKGHMTHDRALSRLLQGTGLTAISINANTWLLQAVPHSAAARPRDSAPRVTDAPSAAPGTEPVDMQGIGVTGSRIPRISLETTMPVTLITREQIEASGFATLFDLLRHQPGMVGHHAVDASTENISQSLTSLMSMATAHSASLHGLGPRGTLYLIDGRRVANYALVSTSLGGMADLGGIPLSMVERVEILRGGASAVYGADAIAGVVNIILRREYRGGEVSSQAGMSERGDAGMWRVSANSGFDLGRLGDLSINADRFSQDHLPGTSRAWHTRDRRADGLPDSTTPLGYIDPFSGHLLPFNTCLAAGTDTDPACRLDRERYRSLKPGIDSRMLHAYWRFPVVGKVEGYADLRAVDSRLRQDTAPMSLYGWFTPESSPRWPEYPAAMIAFYDIGPISSRTHTRVSDATVGMQVPIGHWLLDADLTHRRNRVSNTIHGVVNQHVLVEAMLDRSFQIDGVPNDPELLQALSAPLRIEGDNMIDSFALRAEGPLASWRGRTVRVATGLEHQRDRLGFTPDPYLSDPILTFPLRSVDPSGSSTRTAAYSEFMVPLSDRFTAEAAWRLDRTHDHGSSASPRLGLSWKAGQRFLLRGSIGNAFRAPTLYETGGHPPNTHLGSTLAVPNEPPFSPCQRTIADMMCLLDIHADSNPDLEPERALTRNFGVIWEPWDGFGVSTDYFNIVRKSEIATDDSFEDALLEHRALLRDENERLHALAFRYGNIGRTDTRGLYVTVDWRRSLRTFGTIALRLSGSHILEQTTSTTGAGTVDQAGYLSPATAATGALEWRRGDWSSALSVRHFSAHHAHSADTECLPANTAAGRCRNPSINILTLNTAYTGFGGWTLSGHVHNLTDRRPANYDLSRPGHNPSFDDAAGRNYLIRVGYRF